MKVLPFQYAQLQKAYKRFSPGNLILSKKTFSFFAIGFTFITLAFFGVFAIRPTIITATTLIKNVDDLKKLNIEYENKINSLIRAQSEYEKIREDIPLINDVLPPNAAFSKVAINLEKYADQENITINQLQIDSVPISTPSSGTKLEKYGFNINGFGSYSSIKAFTNHLINWKRLVNIKSIEFNQENSTSSGFLRFSLKGIIYYEP